MATKYHMTFYHQESEGHVWCGRPYEELRRNHRTVDIRESFYWLSPGATSLPVLLRNDTWCEDCLATETAQMLLLCHIKL